jgi:hypothetical protein
MNPRFLWPKGIAVVALLTGFAVWADEALPPGDEAAPTPQQEISAEISAGIHESLTGVTPEITLPAIDVRPPTPVAVGG